MQCRWGHQHPAAAAFGIFLLVANGIPINRRKTKKGYHGHWAWHHGPGKVSVTRIGDNAEVSFDLDAKCPPYDPSNGAPTSHSEFNIDNTLMSVDYNDVMKAARETRNTYVIKLDYGTASQGWSVLPEAADKLYAKLHPSLFTQFPWLKPLAGALFVLIILVVVYKFSKQ